MKRGPNSQTQIDSDFGQAKFVSLSMRYDRPDAVLRDLPITDNGLLSCNAYLI